MKVLRVGPPSGRTHRQRVTFEGGTRLQVRADDVNALGLAPGVDLTDDTWGLVRERAQTAAALSAGLRLLAVRLRSRREIEDRLSRKGYSGEVVAAVVAQLNREGLLDDMRFSRAWVAGRLALRPSGAVRLRQELRQKGVAAEVIEQVLQATLPGSTERTRAVEVARARAQRYRGEPREVAFRRLAGVLRRRGFSSAAIAAALREVLGRSVQGEE